MGLRFGVSGRNVDIEKNSETLGLRLGSDALAIPAEA